LTPDKLSGSVLAPAAGTYVTAIS